MAQPIMTRMRSRRGYGLRIKAWDPQIGQQLPLPIVEDDREKLPPDTVKLVLQWLEKIKPSFMKDRTPTPIVISVGSPINARDEKESKVKLQVKYGRAGDPPEKITCLTFTPATYEMLLMDKRPGRPRITAKFHYLVARDEMGRTICGPYLHHKQTALITLAS